MSEYLNKIIEAASNPPAKAKKELYTTPSESALVAAAQTQAREIISGLPEARTVHADTIDTIVSRERANGSSEGTIARAVMNFASTLENPNTNTPTKHTDLLPANHPLSSAWISVFRVRKATARYFAADPTISEDQELSALVASAIEAEPDTRQRKFYVETLKERAQVQAQALNLIADITYADEIIARKSK